MCWALSDTVSLFSLHRRKSRCYFPPGKQKKRTDSESFWEKKKREEVEIIIGHTPIFFILVKRKKRGSLFLLPFCSTPKRHPSTWILQKQTYRYKDLIYSHNCIRRTKIIKKDIQKKKKMNTTFLLQLHKVTRLQDFHTFCILAQTFKDASK